MIVQKNMKKCCPSLRRVCLAVSRQLGPSLATADRNRRLPLCWRAPSCRQKKTHNHLSVNQWLRSAIFAPQQHSSPIGFQFLKLPPPPCAALLVFPYYFPILSLFFPYLFPIISVLFPYYFPIFSIFLPYFFPIISLLFPYYFPIYFPIFSLLFPFYFSIISLLFANFFPIISLLFPYFFHIFPYYFPICSLLIEVSMTIDFVGQLASVPVDGRPELLMFTGILLLVIWHFGRTVFAAFFFWSKGWTELGSTHNLDQV